jgi:GNAT superfamily N-acetyltransferase
MPLTFAPATEADFERLLALRMTALRESLERVGRFHPERGRRRFRAEFSTDHTRLIHDDGAFAGCVTVVDEADGSTWIKTLYIDPAAQGRGVGARAMAAILADTDARRRPVRLSVLVGSDANRFYTRLGFTETHRDAIDIYYERAPHLTDVAD